MNLSVHVVNPAPGLSGSSASVASAAASSSSSPSLLPFPAFEKAASLPASFSNRRKRTSSIEKLEEETSREQKQQRRGDQCSVIIRRSEESEESETETIYSEQGYETIKAEEENDEGGSSGSDMDTTREVFEVEYDIDSGEEEERPPQVEKCWITDNWKPFNWKPQKWCSVIGNPFRSFPNLTIECLPLVGAARLIERPSFGSKIGCILQLSSNSSGDT